MYPARFRYRRAETLEQALDLLAEHGPEARPLAGGASLVPLMKLRLAAPAVLVDVGHLAELRAVHHDGEVGLGASVRHGEIAGEGELARRLPLLHDAAAGIGDTQIRNMGTVGGSLAEADPAGDWAPALLAASGSVRARSRRGERTLPAEQLFAGPFATALEPDELLTEVRFPSPPGRSGSAHVKFEVRAGDYALACCSVALELGDGGAVLRVGAALGAVGLLPVRLADAESVLSGREPDARAIEESVEAAGRQAAALESWDDARGNAEYRRHLAPVVFERALRQALLRAGGEDERGGDH